LDFAVHFGNHGNNQAGQEAFDDEIQHVLSGPFR
jgi:hypothetical protein